MNIKLEFGVLVFLSMLLFLDFAVGFGPNKPRGMYPPFRRPNGVSHYVTPRHAPRQMPYGPMFLPKPQVYGTPRTPAPTLIKPYKRSQFPPSLFDGGFGQLLPYPNSGPRSMSLDDAFKMGYETGKTMANNDNIRNPGRPMCGLDGGSKCSSGGMTLYNFFFPSKPSTNDYVMDPGFTSPGYDDAVYYVHDQTGDTGNGGYPPNYDPYFDDDDDDLSSFDPIFNDISSDDDTLDNFVTTSSFPAVSVHSDKGDSTLVVTPVTLDFSGTPELSGTVLVPVVVKTIDDTPSSNNSLPPVSSNK